MAHVLTADPWDSDPFDVESINAEVSDHILEEIAAIATQASDWAKQPRTSATLVLGSAAECVRFQKESFGALHQMLAGLDPAEREDVWAEVEDALRRFEGPTGFVGPCEMLVGSGTRP